MDDFTIAPPLVVKDTPKPRRLMTLKEARAYVDEAMRLGRPEPWRELWQRLKTVTSEEEAVEAIGDCANYSPRRICWCPPAGRCKPSTLHHRDMSLLAIAEQRPVAGDQRRAELARVAAMMRSVGSFGGVPGKYDDAINKSGDMSASLTPGTSNKLVNQRSGLIRSCRRPRAASIPTSQAVIGEMYDGTPSRLAVVIASIAAGASLASS